MLDDRPSRTAYRVAMRRAAHQVLDEPPVFVDPLALRILDPSHAATVHIAQRFLDSYLRAFLAVRSRVAEDELARAVSRGTGQYVILGAGLDTFAYRNPYAPGVLRVFEVDHPATQAWKRRRLAEGQIEAPAGVTYVPVDFERDDLAEALRSSGLDPDRPTFFAWLGVSIYLELSSVMATLATIASFAHDGGVVFDYGVTRSRLGLVQRLLLSAMAARVKSVGEPWVTYFDPAVLQDDLRRLGFMEVEDLGPGALNARYFAGRADGLRVGSLAHVMVARRVGGAQSC